MTGHDPDSPVPSTGAETPFESLAGADRTIEARAPADRPPFDPTIRRPRLGGGISLIVAFIGLVGAALGAAWVGLDNRLGISPTGLWGGALTLIAATLIVVGLLLMVGGLGYYVLAPAFGPKEA